MPGRQGTPTAVACGSEPYSRDMTEALTVLAAGRPVVVDDGGVVGGHMVLSAAVASGQEVARMVRYSSGLLFAVAQADILDRLDVPAVIGDTADRHDGRFAVAVDASHGIDTGISGNDRAATLRVLATVEARPSDLVRPGHVIPVRVERSGIFSCRRSEEAAVDLVRLAGLAPVAAVCALVDDQGEVLDSGGTAAFAAEHELPLVGMDELWAYRVRNEPPLARVCSTTIPTAHGRFTAYGYRDDRDGTEHLALVHAGSTPSPAGSILAVHRECVLGDVVASRACRCRANLDHALGTIAATATGGVLIYTRSASETDLGELAAQVLHDLELTSVHMLQPPSQTHNCHAVASIPNMLPQHGINIEGDQPMQAHINTS